MGVQSDFMINRFDVNHLLPDGWTDELIALGLSSGYRVETNAIDVPYAAPDRRPLSYTALGGNAIIEASPWLWDLYSTVFLQLASSSSGRELQLSEDRNQALNLNLIEPGDSYEWHVDTNPITGLLFVTDHSDTDEGDLYFRSEEFHVECRIRPVAGVFLAFDATKVLHTVEPMAQGSPTRVSVPMNFYVKGDGPAIRDRDLDRHVLGDS